MADTATSTAPAIPEWEQLLDDLGSAFSVFAAVEPSSTVVTIAKAVPTVLSVANAAAQESSGGATPAELAQVGIAGAAAVAQQVTTGKANTNVSKIVQGIPALGQLVGDLFNMFTAAKAATAPTASAVAGTPAPAATPAPDTTPPPAA